MSTVLINPPNLVKYKQMKREELKQFILGFQAVEIEQNEPQNIEIFRVNLEKLSKNAKEKLEQGDLGEFEQQTYQNIIAKAESSDEMLPIFAIVHASDFPVQFEVKTGAALAKILREKESVVPSKLLDERQWSKVIGFGQISVDEARDLLQLSYRLASEQ